MESLNATLSIHKKLWILPKALFIIDEISTSWRGRPVAQSKSLRVGSSRQEAQTPLPAAHRKRTCCSLRGDTVNDFCQKEKENINCKFFLSTQ